MISVALATYNGEKYIEEQLESIKNQTLEPDEVVIRDDCSTDKTVEIVEKFILENKLNNWNFEINASNKGYKKNFYDILKIVNGDIVFLSDQDDVWDKNKVSKMVQAIQKNANIKTLNCGIELVNSNLEPVNLVPRKDFYNSNLLYSDTPLKKLNFFDLSKIIKRNISPGCSMCVTKEIKDEFLETYNFVIAHDWYMNLLASLDNGCCFLNEDLIKYRIHQDNTLGVSIKWNIKSKLNSFSDDFKTKLREFKELSEVFSNLNENYYIPKQQALELESYLKARVAFLTNPKIQTLLLLRKFDEYKYSTTYRGRIWDVLVAIKLSKLISK